MARDCLFCLIANGQTETNLVLATEQIAAFPDIDPVAPLHLLIVPKEHIPSAAELGQDHADLLLEVLTAAEQLVAESDFDGYRLVTNVGPDGGQVISHLHFHLLAGRQFGSPTGATTSASDA